MTQEGAELPPNEPPRITSVGPDGLDTLDTRNDSDSLAASDATAGRLQTAPTALSSQPSFFPVNLPFLDAPRSPNGPGSSASRKCHPNPLRLHTTPVAPTLNRPDLADASLAASVASMIAAPASAASAYMRPSSLALQHKTSSSSLRPVSRTPSLKTTGFHGFGSASTASSTVASPIISAMGDVTPLPSPLLSSDSPGPWKKLGKLGKSPPRESVFGSPPRTTGSALVTTNGETLSSVLTNQTKRKAYAELLAASVASHPGTGDATSSSGGPSLQISHVRDRSLSEYIPDSLQIPRRMVTVSASHPKPADPSVMVSCQPHMHREPHLSQARGLTPVEQPPTPPPSESSIHPNDGAVSSEQKQSALNQTSHYEYFEAYGRKDRKRRRWRALRLLGQGTFSRVMLATSQMALPAEGSADHKDPSQSLDPSPGACDDRVYSAQARYDRRTLVAVKICEHGPKGGASEDRIEMSLKRELEIMQSIHHPSLVHLKAWNIEPTRAILVLSYCPGGDLFDVASANRDLLTPQLLTRMFAELVGAVQYLHAQHIVHRDIKLENVLVNIPLAELSDKSNDWSSYPYSVTTLTDLGLSRRVADDEKLETRCGSDDYAAPEVIMGQPYDGRAIDAWSLGVLLYALLDGRLPFDPVPGMSDAHRMRSRTSHRIARVEWRWFEYGGEDGDHEADVSKFRARNLLGAMEVTEGLLRRARTRWTLQKVAETAWVRNAMAMPGGLWFREEEEGEVVC